MSDDFFARFNQVVAPNGTPAAPAMPVGRKGVPVLAWLVVGIVFLSALLILFKIV
jgi:hypothetical protein